MVAGGFAVAEARRQEIEACIREIAERPGISAFHWSEYRGGGRREAYEELVRYAFELVRAKQAAFHVLIARFRDFAHRLDGGSPETSVNRMHFQLSLHRIARFYGKYRAIHLRPDRGNDSRELPQYRDALCAAAFKKYGALPNCVRSIHPRPSTEEPIIQMADVLIGAIAASRNQRVLKPAKRDLAAHVLSQSGRSCWSHDTPKSARFLTVWNFQHQEIDPLNPTRVMRDG